MARKEKKPKREFRPQAHATVYLIALLYVGYLLVSMILRALRGGPEAPTGLQLALGILILGGGAAVLGVLTCLIAFVFVAVVLVKTLVLGDPVGGWPSTMCVILFLGGVQLLCIGILGQYLARTYLEAKRRPVYLVRETEEGVR